jgi:starch-binding outer membrane protein, SusD/RagB family
MKMKLKSNVMKKIFINGLVLLIVLSFSSCEKYLTENPATSLSEASIYNSKSGLEASIVGCYSGMGNGSLWTGDMSEFLGCSSGFIHYKGQRLGSVDYDAARDLVYYTDLGRNYGAYNAIYVIVNRANNIIENIDASSVDEQFRKEIKAEAHLIRAVMYFLAVRFWGDVPLVLKSPKTLEEAHKPRTSYLEVYKQILADLKIAETDMRDEARQIEMTGTTGRPNKWAATAFKAKVYIQIASILGYPSDQAFKDAPDFNNCGISNAAQAWTLALNTAENVISNGPYKLASKYSDLFRWTDPSDYQLKERIFVLQCTTNGATSGWYTALRSLPNNYEGGGAVVTAANSNWGRWRPSRLLFQTFAKTYGGVLGTNRSDKLTNVYVSCPDPRFDASYIHTTYKRYGTTAPRVIYPSNNSVIFTSDNGSENAQAYFKKYLDPKFNATRGYADFYMLRYADMYLMAAEAAAELSTGVGDAMWNKAFGHIETLHARARNSVTPAATQPKWEANRFTTKQQLVDAVFYERLFELSGEGHEWFDERRKGADFFIRNFSNPINAFNQTPSERNTATNLDVWQFLYQQRVYPNTVTEMRKHLLHAFPIDEIRNNNGIAESDQNPYIVK